MIQFARVHEKTPRRLERGRRAVWMKLIWYREGIGARLEEVSGLRLGLEGPEIELQ